MTRRRQDSLFDDILDLLKVTPMWVGPILAVVFFVVFRFLIPSFLPDTQHGVAVGALWQPMMTMLAWAFAGAVMLAWVVAEIWKLMNRRLLDNQSDLASIKGISWREFERLVSEAYRRKGYMAEVVGSDSGDGGVDIRLTGHGETVLVQCKQWKAHRVGVAVVRELLGVVVSEKVARGVVVTSGRFTQEAVAFARLNPRIELLDGSALAELIHDVQTAPTSVPPQSPVETKHVAPACPLCSRPMVLRTARKGQNAGSQFWGCSNYAISGCRGTRPIQSREIVL